MQLETIAKQILPPLYEFFNSAYRESYDRMHKGLQGQNGRYIKIFIVGCLFYLSAIMVYSVFRWFLSTVRVVVNALVIAASITLLFFMLDSMQIDWSEKLLA